MSISAVEWGKEFFEKEESRGTSLLYVLFVAAVHASPNPNGESGYHG